MNFKCHSHRIIYDEDEFCSVDFSGPPREMKGDNLTAEEALRPAKNYLSIVRYYRNEIDDEFYKIETPTQEIEFDERGEIRIELTRNHITIKCDAEVTHIGLDLSPDEETRLRKALKTMFKKVVRLTDRPPV